MAAAPKELPAGAIDANVFCDHCQRIAKSPLPATCYACPCCKIRKTEQALGATVQATVLCRACPITDPIMTAGFGREMDPSFSAGADKFVQNSALICRHCIQFVLAKSTKELVALVKDKDHNTMMPLVYARMPWPHTVHSMAPDEKYSALERLKRNNFLTGAESSVELSSADYLGIGVLQLASAAGGQNQDIFKEYARKASSKHQGRGLPHYSSKSLLLSSHGGSFEKAHTYLTQVATLAAGRNESGVAALAEHRLFSLNQVENRYGERPGKKSVDTTADPAILKMIHIVWKAEPHKIKNSRNHYSNVHPIARSLQDGPGATSHHSKNDSSPTVFSNLDNSNPWGSRKLLWLAPIFTREDRRVISAPISHKKAQNLD